MRSISQWGGGNDLAAARLGDAFDAPRGARRPHLRLNRRHLFVLGEAPRLQLSDLVRQPRLERVRQGLGFRV